MNHLGFIDLHPHPKTMKDPVAFIAQKAFEHFDSPAIFTDESGLLIWCNRAFEALSEYKLEEIKGKTPGSFLQGPESDRAAIKTMSKAIRGKRGFEVEIENYSKSGRKYQTQISCEPVFDDNNKHIGFFSIQPRVTRQKLLQERKLGETQVMLEAIINSAEVAIIIADDDMVVRKVNAFACKMLGYSEEELVGMNVMDYTRKIVKAEKLWLDFLEENAQTGEIELINKTGSIVYAEYKAVANVLPGKHLSVITDISEKKVHEREILSKNHELGEANNAMSTLFSIIGHDLRSPLFSLQSALELLEVPNIEPHEYKKVFESIAQVLDSNKYLLNNLLSWANSQRGGFKVNPVELDVIELINEQCKSHLARAQQKVISIKTVLPAKSLKVVSDPDALNLVLRNLVSNAIKFSNSKDTVTISVEDTIEYVQIKVSDTGKGISGENLEKIFSTGFTTLGSENEKGTGLGLTLCNDFLAQLNSKLQVESELGKGTSFYFNLPKDK